MAVPRFRFGPFLVSPARRLVRQGQRDVPLIPRYFDLLVLLLAERHRVVTRQEIFDRVWADVVVSDGALTQAIRTIRRSLGDDPKEPRFVRTASRQGYQFVGAGVAEEPDDGPLPVDPADTGRAVTQKPADPIGPLLARLLRQPPFDALGDEERREAAEQIHLVDTAEALRRLDGIPGHARARAILRDTRWDVPGAGDVPLVGSPRPWASIAHLVALRLRRAARDTANRWGWAALGGLGAGVVAGAAGGIVLWVVPGSEASPDAAIALAVVGGLAGALGAAGVGAGLASAEALARSARGVALAVCGATGGLLAGALARVLTRAMLTSVFGRDLAAVGGSVEGIVLGAAAGIGYAISTSPLPGGGLAGPRGRARARAAVVTGLTCAAAAVLLTLGGRHLVASSLDQLALAFEGSNVGLAPLARVLGEGSLRPLTRTLVSGFEGLLFGAGLTFGLTHRPRSR